MFAGGDVGLMRVSRFVLQEHYALHDAILGTRPSSTDRRLVSADGQ